MKLVPAKCPSCGANIEVNEDLKNAICQYCGTTILIDDAVEKYKVEISGEVKIDGIEGKSELLKNAETLASIGKYAEAIQKFKIYFDKYPDEYKGYLSYLRMIITDEFIKYKPEFLMTILMFEQNEYKYFLKFAPKEKIEEYKKELYEFCKKHDEKLKDLSPVTLFMAGTDDIVRWHSEIKVKDGLSELYKQKYLINSEKIKLLNEYYFVDIMRAFNIEKLNCVTKKLINQNFTFDSKKYCFYLEEELPAVKKKKSGLCKKNLFGKNVPVNEHGIGALFLRYNIIGVNEDGNPLIAAQGGSCCGILDCKIGYMVGFNLHEISIEEMKKKLSGFEKLEEALERAKRLNNMSFREAQKVLNLNLGYNEKQFKEFSYVFKDGKIIFKAPNDKDIQEIFNNRICVLEDVLGINNI